LFKLLLVVFELVLFGHLICVQPGKNLGALFSDLLAVVFADLVLELN
jgi:hypothetical protein